MIKRILGGECWLMVKWKLTFVHPIRHPVINGPDDSGVRDLIVDGHFRFRPIIDVVLIHVDQSVAARCPARQLQKNRIVPRQRALRSGKLIRIIEYTFLRLDFFLRNGKDSFRDRFLENYWSFGDGDETIFDKRFERCACKSLDIVFTFD